MITPIQEQTVESVGRHYDDLDDYYREIWGEHVHHGLWTTRRETPEQACEQLIRLVAETAGIGDGKLVCDVGCGYGGTARFLVNEYRARVTGLTVSQAQFQYAEQQTNGSDNPRYLLRNWEENGFDAASFDAVISIECLSHVPDKQKYFDEIHRVLKPGGRAAILAWLADATPQRWEVRHLLEPICREGRLPGMGSDEEYKLMIERAGLRLERFEELGKRVRKTWWICARRLLGRLCTSPRYMKALFDSSNGNRVFAITLFRILTAYYTGAMQYGLFVMQKPEVTGDDG
jgi:cyclopropane fatty-acyl-phospholipid synthase-like methyltransferase